MQKSYLIVLVLLAILAIAVFAVLMKEPPTEELTTLGPKDIVYMIGSDKILLSNGRAEVPAAPGSATSIVTASYGNEVTGDLNNDGVDDTAFLLTQSGGSGTFFYVVAALQSQSGYVGTNGILLGDRILPETPIIRDGEIFVQYLDRKQGEPMTNGPSVAKERIFYVENNVLIERVKELEKPEPLPTPVPASFNTTVSILKGTSISFTNGLKLTLTEIGDSRCKDDVQCIWQGELTYTLQVTGANLLKADTIVLGTERAAQVTQNGYVYTLITGRENGLDLTVAKTPVVTTPPDSTGMCYVGGCSNEVCSDQPDVASNCIYKPEFACYKEASCERQTSGECGWTKNPSFLMCLKTAEGDTI